MKRVPTLLIRRGSVYRLLPESKLRDVDVSHLPRDTTIVGAHLTAHTWRLTHGLIVVRVRRVKRDDGVDPGVRTHGTAVLLSAFDGAAPAESVAVVGGERGDLLSVAEDGLGIVAAVVIVLVLVMLAS